MNKLQTIEAEIEQLSVDEQRQLIAKFVHLVEPVDDFFELTPAELVELDRRMLNVNNEPTLSSEDVFVALRKNYAQSDLA